MGVSETRFVQELVLYAASAALSCLVLFAGLRHLDPNRAASKKAQEQKKEIARRLGRPLVQTNPYEDVIACDVINPDHIDVEFESIGGLEKVKQALYELVILPLRRPELFAHGKLLSPQKGVLLYGPPGTGKTMLAKAIAKESGAVFINVRISNLMSKWFGDAQKLVAAVFSLAYKLQPAIIFIDEVDSFLGQRRTTDHEALTNMKTEFMALWDGFTTDQNARVMVLAATNRPQELDEAILRRLPQAFEIGVPDCSERAKILKVILKGESSLALSTVTPMAGIIYQQRMSALRSYNLLLLSRSSQSLHHRHYHLRQMSTDTQSGGAAAVARLIDSGLLKTQGLIGGKWTDAYDGNSIKVHNPATGDVIANVPCMGRKETTDAISSAYDTFNSWSKLTATERSKCLRKWYDLLIDHKEDLAQLITLEQGKPLKEALGEVAYGANFIEYYAEEAKRVYGDIIPSTLADRRLFVLKQPVGVVGAITPWNFPLAMITRKVGPALACGCTVVIKPSELTPLTALAAAELALKAGIPPGVVNVVMGNASDIGDTLLASPQVRKITFTGSTAVGKKLMAGAAGTVKKVSLELGGNAPCIVFDDADLDVAVKGSLAAKFRNSGQTCVCANRIIVQEGIYEKFANAFASAVQNLQVGNGLIEGVAQGPLINEAAVHKVESFVQDATSKGAKVMLGGKRHSLGMTFYEPTVITDVNSEMLVSREEVFGPVAPLIRFKTEEDAIHIANDTNAGLAAYIFTTNISRSWRVTEALEYGLVGVNEGIISTEVAPFGGVKQSGLGREGSKYGMDEYLEIKYVCLGNMNST